MATPIVIPARPDKSWCRCSVQSTQTAIKGWSTTSRPSVPGGWPLTTYISVTTRKGSGLADAITHPLNSQIAIAKSETNSPALAALTYFAGQTFAPTELATNGCMISTTDLTFPSSSRTAPWSRHQHWPWGNDCCSGLPRVEALKPLEADVAGDRSGACPLLAGNRGEHTDDHGNSLPTYYFVRLLPVSSIS